MPDPLPVSSFRRRSSPACPLQGGEVATVKVAFQTRLSFFGDGFAAANGAQMVAARTSTSVIVCEIFSLRWPTVLRIAASDDAARLRRIVAT